MATVLLELLWFCPISLSWPQARGHVQTHTQTHTHASRETEMQQRPLLAERIHFETDWKLRVRRTSCSPTFLAFS